MIDDDDRTGRRPRGQSHVRSIVRLDRRTSQECPPLHIVIPMPTCTTDRPHSPSSPLLVESLNNHRRSTKRHYGVIYVETMCQATPSQTKTITDKYAIKQTSEIGLSNHIYTLGNRHSVVWTREGGNKMYDPRKKLWQRDDTTSAAVTTWIVRRNNRPSLATNTVTTTSTNVLTSWDVHSIEIFSRIEDPDGYPKSRYGQVLLLLIQENLHRHASFERWHG